MQSACQISAYAHYARTPVLQLKQRTDDIHTASQENREEKGKAVQAVKRTAHTISEKEAT